MMAMMMTGAVMRSAEHGRLSYKRPLNACQTYQLHIVVST